jgi:hypothetical protein
MIEVKSLECTCPDTQSNWKGSLRGTNSVYQEAWRTNSIDLRPAKHFPRSAKVTNTHTPEREDTGLGKSLGFPLRTSLQEKRKKKRKKNWVTGERKGKSAAVSPAGNGRRREWRMFDGADSKINLYPKRRDFRRTEWLDSRTLCGLRGYQASRRYRCARPRNWVDRSPCSQRAWPF